MNNKIPLRGEIWLVDYSFKFSNLQLKEKSFALESQIKKIRPCIIISNNLHNELCEWVFVIPLTSEGTLEETREPLEFLIKPDKFNKLTRESRVLLPLMTYISKEYRLKKAVGFVGEEIVNEIVKRLNDLIK